MASFHRVALGLLLAVIVGGCLAALFPPSCQLRGRPAPEPPPAVQQEPPPAPAPAAPRSVGLDAIAAGAAVPRPSGWPPFGDPDSGSEDTREEVFVARILPLVLMVDDEALARRARLWSIRQEINGGGKLPPEDRLWLSDAFERYQVEQADMAALTRRIDAAPPSILIAAAAIATGWNAANEAGWRAMAAAARAAMAAPSAESGPSSAPPLEALRLYLWMINAHPDFGPFRRARERARQGGIPLAGAPLSATLPRVAPGRLPGATALAAVIADYRLGRFDAARLAEAGPDGAR